MTILNTLSTLDTVIAIVIVLLVLSLIVQAIQTIIKKIFKIKSGTLLNSLEDLFQYIDIGSTGKSPKGLVKEVTAELKKLGRVSFRGNLMIDSIARDDLIKILRKLEYDDLVPKVEAWFDTVMQSFEERYTRHMKSVAVGISIVVVVYLNANFFRIYRDISTSDVKRAMIAEQAPRIMASAERQLKDQEATPSPSPSPTATISTPGTSRKSAPPQTQASLSPAVHQGTQNSVEQDQTTSGSEAKDDLMEAGRMAAAYVEDFESFGFSPLTWDQTVGWFFSLWGQTLLRDEKGRPVNAQNKPITKDCVQIDKDGKSRDCERVWRPMTSREWWASRRHDINGLFGWGIMALLLSVGAPFWQDALESLFGIKNLLRKKSDTKNVEEQQGGQPRP